MSPTGMGKKVTLDRFFSKKGLASRGTAAKWIEAGEVKVNGRVCRERETWVDPDLDVISRNETVAVAPDFQALIYYKDRGTITTHSDEQGRKTVYADLPADYTFLHAVGRLDQATSGLLILTNSTLVSAFLTDPVNEVERVYLATVKGEWLEEYSAAIEKGIKVEGEFLQASKCVLRKKSKKESHLVLTLKEGKNREIRRLTAYFKCPVIRLKRVQYGPFTLGELQPGKWKSLEKRELQRAFPSLKF